MLNDPRKTDGTQRGITPGKKDHHKRVTTERPSRLKVYKAVFEPKVTQDASELGVGVVFVSWVVPEYTWNTTVSEF